MALVATVTIPAVNVSADLTDFIVTIDLSDLGATFWETVAGGGGDIRCYKADGTTELARDIEACATATDTGVLHVKYSGTLSSSSDTDIQIHADGSSADYAVTDTYGRNAVWSDYAVVWHFDSLSSVDATGNGHNLFDASSGGCTVVTGILGSAVQFTDAGNGLRCDTTVRGNNSFSQSCLFSSPDTSADNAFFIDDGDGTSGGFQTFLLSDGKIRTRLDDSGSNAAIVDTSGTFDDNSPHVLNVVVDKTSTLQHYVDGSANGASGNISGFGDISPTANDTEVGDQYNGDKPFVGLIDEYRLREDVLSPGWIDTESANLISISTFYSVTDEGGGGGSTIEASAGFTTNHSVSASRAAVFNAAAGFSISHSVSNGGQAELTAEAVISQAHTLSASGQQDLQASIALANTLGLQSSYGAIVEAAASLTTNHSLTVTAISTLVAHSALSISSNLAASSNATLGAEAVLTSNHTVQSTTGSTIDAAASLLLTSSISSGSDISLEGLADFSMSCSIAAEVIAQLNAFISLGTVQSLIAQTNAVLLAQSQFQTNQTVQVVGGQTIEAVGELSLVSSVDASGNITTSIEFTPLDDGRKVTVLAQSRTVTVLAQNRIVTVH